MATYYLTVLKCLIFVCFSIKLGVIEDQSNRTRLAKLLRFYSSNSDTEQTSLPDYIERMKEKQEAIYFIAGTSRSEVCACNYSFLGLHVDLFVVKKYIYIVKVLTL